MSLPRDSSTANREVGLLVGRAPPRRVRASSTAAHLPDVVAAPLMTPSQESNNQRVPSMAPPPLPAQPRTYNALAILGHVLRGTPRPFRLSPTRTYTRSSRVQRPVQARSGLIATGPEHATGPSSTRDSRQTVKVTPSHEPDGRPAPEVRTNASASDPPPVAVPARSAGFVNTIVRTSDTQDDWRQRRGAGRGHGMIATGAEHASGPRSSDATRNVAGQSQEQWNYF
jgi:hypothetical protein